MGTRQCCSCTSGIFLVSDVFDESRVHGVDGHKEGLDRRVVGDAAAALGVTLHAVHKDLDTTAQGTEELLLVICLSVLVPL